MNFYQIFETAGWVLEQRTVDLILSWFVWCAWPVDWQHRCHSLSGRTCLHCERSCYVTRMTLEC